MLIYNYNPITLEYTYSEEAEKDYVASQRTGKFVPVIPAYATLDTPPKNKKGYAIIFKGEWTYIQDHRGQHVINTITEEDEYVNYLGPLKEDFVDYDEYINSEEYKKKQEEREKQRILMLTMTKWDFLKYVLKPHGIDYPMLMNIVNSNVDYQEAWNLCERVYRGDEILVGALSRFIPDLTDEELDQLFEEHGV